MIGGYANYLRVPENSRLIDILSHRPPRGTPSYIEVSDFLQSSLPYGNDRAETFLNLSDYLKNNNDIEKEKSDEEYPEIFGRENFIKMSLGSRSLDDVPSDWDYLNFASNASSANHLSTEEKQITSCKYSSNSCFTDFKILL